MNPMDLLHVQQSSSRPSLLSSFWSIHAQLPNGGSSNLDLRSSSLISLPEAQLNTQTKLKASRSLGDLRNGNLNVYSLYSLKSIDEPFQSKVEKPTVNIQEWLQKIQPPTIVG